MSESSIVFFQKGGEEIVAVFVNDESVVPSEEVKHLFERDRPPSNGEVQIALPQGKRVRRSLGPVEGEVFEPQRVVPPEVIVHMHVTNVGERCPNRVKEVEAELGGRKIRVPDVKGHHYVGTADAADALDDGLQVLDFDVFDPEKHAAGFVGQAADGLLKRRLVLRIRASSLEVEDEHLASHLFAECKRRASQGELDVPVGTIA